jgi:hypothetical protein
MEDTLGCGVVLLGVRFEQWMWTTLVSLSIRLCQLLISCHFVSCMFSTYVNIAQNHVSLTRKFNQEGLHLDKHQKAILSIWTSRFGLVLHYWNDLFDWQIIRLFNWSFWQLNSAPCDWSNLYPIFFL